MATFRGIKTSEIPYKDKDVEALNKSTKSVNVKVASEQTIQSNSIYGEIKGNNWYKTYPYRFVIQINNAAWMTYALPIPPEMLSVRPVYASDAVPTMGGVIEECSPVTFWQIAMAGTMPHGVKRESTATDVPASVFRDALSTTGLVTSVISGIAQPAMSLLAKGQNIYDAASNGWKTGVTGGLLAALQPAIPYSASSVNDVNNGYVEIHRMQKFFLFYEKAKSRFSSTNTDGSQMTLIFENIKDGQKFRVIPKQTDFTKTAASPYTYKYNIILLAWNISYPGAGKNEEVNRFGKDGDLQTVNTLTVESMKTGIKNASSFLKKGFTKPLGTFFSVPPVL
jgi:hypothetical protein